MWTRIVSRVRGIGFRGTALQRAGWGAGVMGVGVLAFCWGRSGAWSQVPASNPRIGEHRPASAMPSDYGQRAVAYIYGNVALTREDLGEFLISRFASPERLEFFVNCAILDRACRAKGITVTDTEVDAQVVQDVHVMCGPTVRLAEFEKQLLAKYNKTLFEYKEDVVRHRLKLSKLVRGSLAVTEDDVRKAFEAKYGPKVQCRMIQFMPDDKHRFEVYQKVSKSEEAFASHAKNQFNPYLGPNGGKVPPIHRNFGDAQIERKAFSLKAGEVSELLQIEDKTWIILKCDEHIPANIAAKYEEERTTLFKEVSEFKLAQEMPKLFARLRQEANPRILVANRPVNAADLEREVRKEIEPPAPNQSR